ncbi:MAG: chemotaxis protein CheB [Steroidobacteraceae bacterium]
MSPADISKVEAVVIGGSAGSVEALSVLLPALTAESRVSVLIVIHLPRERPSMLIDLFTPRCALPVREAQDKDPVEPGSVYFAPPDYHLLVEEGRTLALSVDEPVNFSRPSIDVLFESAADVFGPRLMGVILTGANEDGAAGLKAIRRTGGMALVQEPSSAQVPFMPAAALKAVPDCQVLGLDQLAELFQTLRGAES